jgi:large subunit ribosomal protein L21
MFAVILSGAKQHLVKKGDVVRVEKVNTEEGNTHTFSKVLLVSKDGEHADIGAPFVSATVDGKVLRHARDDKVRIYKMKAKKNYRRTQGHRQWFTDIQIEHIGA